MFSEDWVQNLGFSNFPVLSLIFEESLFAIAKTLKIYGFQQCFVFLLFKEKKRAKQMITGISDLASFGSKNGRFVTIKCFCCFGLLKSRF